MSRRITQKEVKETHVHVIAVRYGALQSLLCCRSHYAYTERKEGWGADIYSIGTYAIATGYAPFGDVKPPYEVLKKYEDMAARVRGIFPLDYEGKKAALDNLLWEFIEEVVKGKGGKLNV